MLTPTMSVEEVEKKIAELKAVETWLTMNVGFVLMTVKILEMQKAALESLQAAAGGPADKTAESPVPWTFPIHSSFSSGEKLLAA